MWYIVSNGENCVLCHRREYLEVEDSATALGVLANRGIKGSEAGNKLSTVLINLTSGTGQAGEMMKKLGISAFDSEGKFIGLQATLEQVNKATAGLTEEERNAALAAIGGKTQIDTLNDPASDPLIPLFARTPSAVALSSTSTPKLFKTPPQPIYASISCCAV